MPSPEIVQRARELRKDPTESETLLWAQLRNRRLGGYKFRRQHPFEGFILDFYCAEARLGIELDGEVHRSAGNAEYDRDRTEILEWYNIIILRFWNSEVLRSLEGVLSRILKEAETRTRELKEE